MSRYLLVPFGVTPLTLVMTFTIGLVIAANTGWAGIPLGVILISWFFKYCFVLLDSVVAGEDEPPVLSVEMVNPLSEQRPVLAALLIGFECAGVVLLGHSFGLIAAFAAGVLVVLALPAHLAALSIGRSVLQAMWPPALVEIARILGRDYLMLTAMILALGLVGFGLAAWLGSVWSGALLVQLFLLTVFALIGGTVFEHRHALGIESKTRAERMAERDAREHQAERHRMLDHAFSSFRVSKPLEGWQQIEAWVRLHAQGEKQDAEYRALLEASSQWDDMRVADRLANDYAVLLLGRRSSGAALSVIEQRVAANPRFRAATPALGVRLAELAGAAGKKGLQRALAQAAGDAARGDGDGKPVA
jgi:hypothetical protein